jgi:hypothetical protein
MTALEKRCGELMADLDRLGSINHDKGIQDQVTELEKKATILAENSAALRVPLDAMMAAGLCAGVIWVGMLKMLDDLDGCIEKVLIKLKESPEKINDGKVWPRFETLAHKAANDLRVTLKSQWKEFVTLRTLNRVSVFSVFKGLAQCREAINKLEELERVAKSRLDSLPQASVDVTFIIGIDEKMTGLINGLGISDEPSEMIEFLKRCASVNGVPLSELTDDRLTWLRSKGFEESLRVRG